MDECNANYFVKIAGEGWIRNIPSRLLLPVIVIDVEIDALTNREK